jgi:DNA-binding MarR family transcriptional regulator
MAAAGSAVESQVDRTFVAAWDAFFRAVRRRRGREAQVAGRGLSIAQYHLVDGLRDGSLTVGTTAIGAGISVPTASRMIDVLVADGYVKRVPSPLDRRVVEVSLTAAGRRALRAKDTEIAEFRAAIVASLTEEQRELGADVLLRLAEAVDDL